LRIARIDEGDGPAVIFLHGEPTWSFLWRKVVRPVHAAGFRCIVPDLAGFGRSDKPLDVGWYSYDRHTALVRSLVEELDLSRSCSPPRRRCPAPRRAGARSRRCGWTGDRR
jgi:haloalkane dehalogenase